MNTMSEVVRSVVRGRNRAVADPQFIADYAFPPGMIDRALARCPESARAAVLEAGLRQFFLAAAADPDLRASMPSRVVDEAWHEFITFTRAYEQFCRRAFGRFLHHEPEYLMELSEATANQSTVLLATWRTACLSAGLDPDTTRTAPILFAADPWAGIDKARTYVATCGSAHVCTTSYDVVCVEHELRGPVQQDPSRRRDGSGGEGSGCGTGGDGGGGGCAGGGCGSGGCGGGE
jgi:hypothetical protein